MNIRRLLTVPARFLALYALFGFTVVPIAVHFSVFKLSSVFLSAPLQLGAVQFNPFTLKLTLQSVTVGNVEKPLVGFSELSADLSWSSLTTGTLIFDSVDLNKPFGHIVLQEGGRINLASLLKTSASEPETDTAQQNTEEPSAPGVRLNQVNIREGLFHFTDKAITKAAGQEFAITISDVQLSMSGMGWPEAAASATLSGNLGESGAFAAEGSLNIPTPEIQASVQLDDISLPLIQPYLTPASYIVLRSGLLSGKADLAWGESKGFNASSVINIVALQLEDDRDDSDIAGWSNLQLDNMQFSQQQNRLDIQSLMLTEPSIRIAIDQNLQINLADLMKPSTAEPEAAASADAAISEPMVVIIDEIAIEEGNMDFSDYSFQPGFAAPVSKLNGSILGLDSSGQNPAKIAIEGQIDRYSPVNIQGVINTAAPLDKTRIGISFDHVELTTLTPYSGRFAGYSIHKGRMDLNLDYDINKSELKADNRMLLEHLTLGDRVESDEALDLPLKLAIALLKDRDGRIDVQLPVRGNLDNPEFELGPVLRMALLNMLTNIISAPFDILASLVGGDASELATVTFDAGSVAVTQNQQASLDKLAKALIERPELELEVTGTAVRENDWPLIARQLLQDSILESWERELLDKGETIAYQSLPPVPQDDFLRLLRDIAGKQGVELTAELDQDAAIQTTLDNWPYSEVNLRKLAIDRARGIKDYLTGQGLDAERIFLLDAEIPAAEVADNAEADSVDMKLELTAP